MGCFIPTVLMTAAAFIFISHSLILSIIIYLHYRNIINFWLLSTQIDRKNLLDPL